MKPSELAILLGEGEGSMLEYKESLSSSFARELALANSAGGKILGVRDDGTVKGIVDSNKLRARIQDRPFLCNHRGSRPFSPPLRKCSSENEQGVPDGNTAHSYRK